MAADLTRDWWQSNALSWYHRWFRGVCPHPDHHPQPVDVDRLIPQPGISLPAPVSSGLALDVYSKKQLITRHTPAGREMHRFKYRGDFDAGWRLVCGAAEYLKNHLELQAIDYILAAPHGLEYRPLQPTVWLARRLATLLQIPALTTAFELTRLVGRQKGLRSREERQRNAAGLFRLTQNARRRIAGHPVLLFDDLCHSGWTLAELRKILVTGGCGKVYVFAFVRAGRLDQKGIPVNG